MAQQITQPRAPSRIHDYIGLGKPLIGLLAAATAVAGCLAYQPNPAAAGWVAIGVFLLACGAGSLNNCQDRFLDGRLRRTAGRPLARERISLGRAMVVAMTLGTAGLTVLWIGPGSLAAAGLGLGCLIIYNGLYTPLKRTTPFAFVPGSLAGLLCAYLGWVAAGGQAPSRAFLVFLAVVGAWQFPHLLLIQLIHREDWLRSNLPTILRRFAVAMLEKWVVLWLLSYAVLTCLLYLLGMVRTDIGAVILLANGFILVLSAMVFLAVESRKGMYRLLRGQLVVSQAIVILLVMCQGWLGVG